MPNRATRRHADPTPPADTGPTGPTKVTLPDGAWYQMGEMTGRDFLTLRGMQGRKLTDQDVADVLTLIGKRCTGSSFDSDPLDRPITELLDVLRLWFTAKENDALPPPTATS